MKKHQSVYLNTIFLLLIFGFAAANILRPQKERSETENRTLVKRPALTWDSLISGDFAREYGSYLSDQFILRDEWITLRTGLERASLKQETNDVYFASDDYLIEKHTGVFTSGYRQAEHDPAGHIFQNLGSVLLAGALVLHRGAERGEDPEEKLPAFADPYDEELYLDQIKAALPEGVWFDALDVLGQIHVKRTDPGSFITGPIITGRRKRHLRCVRPG